MHGTHGWSLCQGVLAGYLYDAQSSGIVGTCFCVPHYMYTICYLTYITKCPSLSAMHQCIEREFDICNIIQDERDSSIPVAAGRGVSVPWSRRGRGGWRDLKLYKLVGDSIWLRSALGSVASFLPNVYNNNSCILPHLWYIYLIIYISTHNGSALLIFNAYNALVQRYVSQLVLFSVFHILYYKRSHTQ